MKFVRKKGPVLIMDNEQYIFAVCHSFQVRVITYIFNNGVSSFIDSYFAKTDYEKQIST